MTPDAILRLKATTAGSTIGPRSWDLGCLAVWSGGPKAEALFRARQLAELAGADPIEVSRWAIVRAISSALLGYQRQDFRQFEECSTAVPVLIEQWSEINS
jgi:hypothetical protein